jgi:hypothetical protein
MVLSNRFRGRKTPAQELTSDAIAACRMSGAVLPAALLRRACKVVDVASAENVEAKRQ